MPPLDRDRTLLVKLHAVCSQHQYTANPGQVIDELRTIAGARSDLVAQAAGEWAGYREADEGTRVLVQALLAVPGAEEWAGIGRQRRSTPVQNSGPR